MTTAATHIAEPYGEGKVLIRDVELFAGYDPEIDDSREDADEMRKWDDEKVRDVVDRTKFYMARGAYPKLVKLHQREGQDTPDESFGDIVEIRYEGRSGVPMIVGDIVVSEQTFKRDIASGAFPRRSAEIWPDGYLSEVALLGRETPARPLPDMRFSRNATTGAAPMVFVRNVEPATFAFDESKIKRANDGKFATKEERAASEAASDDTKSPDVSKKPNRSFEEQPDAEDDVDIDAADFAEEIAEGRMEIGDAAEELAAMHGLSFADAEKIIEGAVDEREAEINRNYEYDDDEYDDDEDDDDEKDSAIEPDLDGMEDDARDLASQVRDGSLGFDDAIASLSVDFMISEGDAADLLQTAIDAMPDASRFTPEELQAQGRAAIDAMPDASRFTPEELQAQGRAAIDAMPHPNALPSPEQLAAEGRSVIDGQGPLPLAPLGSPDAKTYIDGLLAAGFPTDDDIARQEAMIGTPEEMEFTADIEELVPLAQEDVHSTELWGAEERLAAKYGLSMEAITIAVDALADELSTGATSQSERRSERSKEMDRVANSLADSLATGDMDWPAVLKGMTDSFPNASLDLIMGALNDARLRTQKRFSRRGRKQTFNATYPGAGNTTTPAYGDKDMDPVDDDREIMSRLEELEETYGRSRFAKACRSRYERHKDDEAETFGLAEADEEKLGYQRSRKGRIASKSSRSTESRRREFARRLAAMKAAPKRDAALKRMNARLAALESRNNALRAELDRAEFSRAIDQMEAEGFRFNGQRETILDDIVGSRDPEGRMDFYRSVLPQAPIGQRIPTTGVRINQTAGAMSEDKIQFAREKAKAKAIASRGTNNPITYSEAFDAIVANMSKEA